MIQVIVQAARQTLLPALAFAIALATPALAQAPSAAQKAAIKSNCRNDYMAHCSAIPPGGAASLQCLQQNMASLSSACAGAVKAVSAPSETKAEPAAAPKEETKSEPAPAAAPAAAEPAKTATEPAAKSTAKAATAPSGKPSSAQIAAVRANCRSDYPKVCAGVPTGGAPALQCLAKNKAKLSAACEKAVAAAAGGAGTPAGGAPATANASPGAAPAAAATPALVLRPMRPREVLFVMRSACGADVHSLCAGTPAGGGRIIECLVSHSASLSPACQGVLGQFAR